MATIKAVVFDVGGVLRFETDRAIQRDIQATLGITPEAFTEPWRLLTNKLGRGVMTENEFWKQLHHLTGATRPVPTESLLMREYQKGHQLNEAVLAIVQQLRTSGYKTAVLSNTIKSHAEFNRAHGVYEGFDVVVLSHEVGLRKPSPEIFHHTLHRLGVLAQEAVLVDDLEKNIIGAGNIGMPGVLFKNAPQLAKALKHLGISIDRTS